MARFCVSCSCVLLLLMAAVSASTAVREPRGIRLHGAGRKVGCRTDVKGVEGDAEMQELGRFSVEERNRRAGVGRPLEFGRVVAAQRQVVAGIKYYLRVAATEEGRAKGAERVFDAVVVVKPWLGSRALLAFAPAAAK